MSLLLSIYFFFFFNDTATTEIYTLSLHDALPISMRKTITGTGGMLLLQTLKDAGVEYLFTNPGSAETGIFAALAEDVDHRLVVGKHERLVTPIADGCHRNSGKVPVVIQHGMGRA